MVRKVDPHVTSKSFTSLRISFSDRHIEIVLKWRAYLELVVVLFLTIRMQKSYQNVHAPRSNLSQKKLRKKVSLMNPEKRVRKHKHRYKEICQVQGLELSPGLLSYSTLWRNSLFVG